MIKSPSELAALPNNIDYRPGHVCDLSALKATGVGEVPLARLDLIPENLTRRDCSPVFLYLATTRDTGHLLNGRLQSTASISGARDDGMLAALVRRALDENCMIDLSFDGKVVVVTGAGRGLGLACAEAFAAHGAEVVLVARNRSELEERAASIRESGGRASVATCDVTDAIAVRALFDAQPRCDVLVNNAGGNRPQPFLEVDLETLDALLALNVRSMFVAAQAAARSMASARSGVIINMSSQMGHVGGPNRTVYCTTKHAIEGLTKAMAVELAPLGVRVNSVAPTYIETPMTKPFFADETFRRDTLQRIPLGRLGTVAEVAAAVVFLASGAASLITGASLLVDGAYTAQ